MKGGGVFNHPMFKTKKSKQGRKKNVKKTSRVKGIRVSSSFGIGRCTATTSSPSIIIINNNDCLVSEILTRLPVKTLFRFKSVCKNWSSLIQKDQCFIDLHLTRSKTRLRPRLFIVVPLPPTEEQKIMRKRYLWPFKEFHITAELLFEEEECNGSGRPCAPTKLKLVVDTVRKIDSSSYDIISNPVNGLVCLIKSFSKRDARIYNISTGEISPWFQSSSVLGEKHVNGIKFKHKIVTSQHGFGFDPATNEHKLVCVWTMMSKQGGYFICEVLTIGQEGNNNRWRTIEGVPPTSLEKDYVYVNGVIYWTTRYTRAWAYAGYSSFACLVAFDVGTEKFRTIRSPDFILDHPLDVDRNYFHEIVKLFEVDGNLAMAVRRNNSTFHMYIYQYDHYKDKEVEEEINGTFTSSSPKKNERWSKVNTINLPFNMETSQCVTFHSLPFNRETSQCCQSVTFHSFVGSDDKIFVTSTGWGHGEMNKYVSVYCYNWKKRSWTEVDVSGIPSSVPQLCPTSFSATFSESLLVLNNHNTL